MSVILMIMDGVGDLPTPEKTPLQAAKKPNMDKLAAKSITGMMHPIAPYVVPGSDTSHLNYFGYDPTCYYPGRGPLEALGVGIELKEGDVAFRANFATLDENGNIVDRRAGRIDTEEAHKLGEKLSMKIEDVDVMFKATVEHRGVVVLRGRGICERISDTDPHRINVPPNDCVALEDDEKAKKTARIVNEYLRKVKEVLSKDEINEKRKREGKLEANFLLLRGAGKHRKIESIMERYHLNAVAIAGGALYRGVARYVGMDVIMLPTDTGDKDTNLKAKADAAVFAAKKYDLIFLHIKATDNFGHDGDFEGKKKMIERIDK